MKQPITEPNDALLQAEAHEPAAAQMDDMQLTDEELDGIKGGPLCHGTTVLAWARVDGVSPLGNNHNEAMAEDAAPGNTVDDLPLTEARETSVKAGGWGASMYQYAHNDPSYSRPPVADSLVRP